MTRLLSLIALLLAVSPLHADDVVLEKTAAPHPVITLQEGQTLRGADPNVHPVVSGIILAKNTTVSGIDVVATSGGTAIKGGEGTIVIENSVIRDASNRGIDIDGASRVTIRNVQIIGAASRNGVSASTCAGDVRGYAITNCNAPLFLQNAGNVSLEKVVIDGSAQLGIAGENINGLRMTDVEVKNAGNESSESAVVLRNASGDVVLTNCRFHDSAGRELHIENTKGEVRVRIEHSTFTHGGEHPEPALAAGVSGDASLSIDVASCTFSSGGSNGVHATAAERGKLTLHVSDSNFDRNAGAIVTGVSASATLDYALTGNTIRRSSLGAINVSSSGSGIVRGTIARNDIAAADPCDGCEGIRLLASNSGQLSATIDSNKIERVQGSAVHVMAGGASDVRVAITKNTTAGTPIDIQAGTLKKDTAVICADIRDNTSGPITVWNKQPGTTLKLAGFKGDGKNIAAVAASLGRNNHGAQSEAKLTTDPAGNAFAAGDGCAAP